MIEMINFLPVFIRIGNQPAEYDIITTIFYVVSFWGVIGLVVYILKRWMDKDTLKVFSTKFLNLENEEREKLLKKYLKSKNKEEVEVAGHIFLTYYKEISGGIREEILGDLPKQNIKRIKKLIKEGEWNFIEQGYGDSERVFLQGNLATEILKNYFDIISSSIRNEIITQSLNTNDEEVKGMICVVLNENFDKFDVPFRNEVLKICDYPNDEVLKLIRANFSNIPQQILNRSFLQLSEADDKSARDNLMEILYKYDKSACIDEKIKEEVLRKYIMRSGYEADTGILKKFLERGIYDQELRQDILNLIKYLKNLNHTQI